MSGYYFTALHIEQSKKHLVLEERSNATIEKYIRDVSTFDGYVGGREITKEMVIAYKVTVEAARKGEVTVSLKGKTRTVLIVNTLKKKLLNYAKEHGIVSGRIFITRTGKPISRTNVWRDMKALCEKANVNPDKVFPHNLRHLFARVFYAIKKDISKLADVLGHSNINTTRIYIRKKKLQVQSEFTKI